MGDPVVKVEGLGKRFSKLGSKPNFLSKRIRSTLRKLTVELSGGEAEKAVTDPYFWALRDINFTVNPGESLGVIGHNGAGKSTLLKIMSRVLPPTEGRVELLGTVNSLLEVGTGFQKDLSGRMNIYLNASILGMSRDETNEVFDEIVDFSGVGEFIDMPVKYYSSGMHSRLAFSIAANVTGDVLLVDEVLAVGDASFRKKCLERMNNLLGGQRSILFVSHNMNAISKFCTKTMWLDHGQMRAYGETDEVITEYLKSENALAASYSSSMMMSVEAGDDMADEVDALALYKTHEGKDMGDAATSGAPSPAPGDTNIRQIVDDGPRANDVVGAEVVSIHLANFSGDKKEVFRRREPIWVVLCYRLHTDDLPIVPVVHLHCAPRHGVVDEVHVLTTFDADLDVKRSRGEYRSVVEIPANFLISGTYYFSMALVTPAKPLIRHVRLTRILACEVIDEDANEVFGGETRGVLRPDLGWRTDPVVTNVGDDQSSNVRHLG